MKNAINSIAAHALSTGARGIFLIYLLALAGCAQRSTSVRPAVYDFGPGALSSAPAQTAPTASAGVPIIVAEMESNPALDSTAILYRLAYDNAQQLHPYAQARWSVLPAQLLRQRLRDQLGQRHTLISPADTRLPSPANPAPTPATSPPLTLRLELEEFSQLFESPDKSVGLLRLRVTATQSRVGGEKWLAQRHIIVQRPAPSANAPGGVQALTQATDAAVLEIDAWLQDVAR